MQNIKRIKVQSTKCCAAEFSRKTLPEQISESVTPTVTTRNKTNPSAEKRFPSTNAPLSRAVTSSSRPFSRSRTPAVAVSPMAPVPVSWHPAYWFYKLVHEESDESTLLSLLPVLSVSASSLPSSPIRLTETISLSTIVRIRAISGIRKCHMWNIFLCRNFICECKKRKKNEMAFYLRKSIPKAFSYLTYQYRYFKRDV